MQINNIKEKLKSLLKDERDLKIAEDIINLLSKDNKILFIGMIGSHAHGTEIETSDIDFKIIFQVPSIRFSEVREQFSGINIIRKKSDLSKLRDDFVQKNKDTIFDVKDKKLENILSKHVVNLVKYNRINKDELLFDCEAIELNHWIQQLKKSNSNPLELLYLPEKAIIYKDEAFDLLIKNRSKFITLQSKEPFLSYTYTQIEKMTNENRKFNLDPEEMKIRKSPLYFLKAFEGKNEVPLLDFLKEKGLDQRFCGLVHIPHNHKKMMDFIKHHGKNIDDWYTLSFHLSKQLQLLTAAGHNNNLKNQKKGNYRYTLTYALFYDENAAKRFGVEDLTKEQEQELKQKYKGTFKGYKGIIKETEDGQLVSNELRVSSIPKDEKLVTIVSYDMNGYSEYCKVYKSYWDWVNERNQERYRLNLAHNKMYDCYLEEETEFLTEFGWKKFDEIIKFNYHLASLDKNNKLVFENYITKFDDLYSGLLYTLEKRYTKFSVTPYHKLYFSDCHRSPSNNFSVKYIDESSNWHFEKVEDYFNSKKSFKHVLLTPLKFNKKEEFFSDDLIKIIGAYISDGSLTLNDKKLPKGFQISQNIDRKLAEIIKSTRYKFYEVKDKRKEKAYSFVLGNIKLGNFLFDNFNKGSLHKRLPFKFINQLSIRQIDILIESLLAGDGHCHKKGHSVYYTSNYELAKDIQLLFFLKGQSTQIYKYRHKGGFEKEESEKYQVFIPVEKKNIITISKDNRDWIKKEIKNKRIVCFEVPSSLLITKNNDKISIQGNSKNAQHSVRIIETYKELLETGELRLLRPERRDFYLDIKLGKLELEDVLKHCDTLIYDVEKLYKDNPMKLPSKIDQEFLNDLLMQVRNFGND